MKNGNYVLAVAPKDYPGKKYRDRYCYEHRLVWWQNTGHLPQIKEIIHHKNGNFRDNRFKNLELLPWGQHSSLHHKPAPIIDVKCSYCGKVFQRQARIMRSLKKLGRKDFYCNRSCMGSHQIFKHIKSLNKYDRR